MLQLPAPAGAAAARQRHASPERICWQGPECGSRAPPHGQEAQPSCCAAGELHRPCQGRALLLLRPPLHPTAALPGCPFSRWCGQ